MLAFFVFCAVFWLADINCAPLPQSEENATPNLQDLEDSFGGLPTEEPTPRPANKQIGVYYLLDWNTIFDIDDQKGTRVNLRFQPKVGDPSRFFAVNIP